MLFGRLEEGEGEGEEGEEVEGEGEGEGVEGEEVVEVFVFWLTLYACELSCTNDTTYMYGICQKECNNL